MNSLRIRTIAIARFAALSVLVGCASAPPSLQETLDERTGVTLTVSSRPLVLYRDNPSRAAYARNYVHIGPIQVNRSGEYRYFLWLGIWNTLHSEDFDEHRLGFDSIILFVDGEPVALDVSGWTPDAIGASAPVYPGPVAATVGAYYRVSSDLIRLLADSGDIRLRTGGLSPREYTLWDDQLAAKTGLRAFALQSAL